MENRNSMKNFMKSDYRHDKLDKSNELNESMSISPSSPDEYTNKVRNIGGNNNA